MKRIALLLVLLAVALPGWAKERAPKAETPQTFCAADDNVALAIEVVRAAVPPAVEGLRPVKAEDTTPCWICDFYWDLAIWADDEQLSLEYAVKSVGCSVKNNCY